MWTFGEGGGWPKMAAPKAEEELLHQSDRLLFSNFTNTELLTTLLNLHMLACDPLVSFSIALLTSPHPAIRFPSSWLAKHLVYSHFCAGHDLPQASSTLLRLWELGLHGILNYSLEDAPDSAACDRNAHVFLETIRQSRSLPPRSVSFACVKLTALCPLSLLERISELLRWQHKNASFKLPWREDGLPLFAPASPMFNVLSEPQPLSPAEEEDWEGSKQRLWKLCKESREVGVPLLVDAEYTSVQPAIDYLTYAAALDFNTPGSLPLVYGTMQAYLTDSFPRLALAMDAASKRNVPLGVKLVRGAYIDRESALAASLNVPSPIHSCIEQTHHCYDASAMFLLERVAAGQGSVIFATHNINSGRAAAAKAMELGLSKRDGRVQFGQLKGMADGLSLALVRAGFRVSKYLAFGPMARVMPYLIRRAEENRGMLRDSVADRHGMRAHASHL